MSLQKKATIIASFCAIFLAIIKFIVGFSSGSVAILASAIDSLVDFVISILNFLALKKASQKSNEKYNFGFSKIEALMGLFESAVILLIGIYIFYESVMKIYNQESITDLNLGIYIMVFALVVTFVLVLFLSYVAKKTQSLIVESDCLHYKSDVLTNFLTLLALIIIYLTEFYIIDAIFGILVSFYIAFSAFKIMKKSLAFLMDKALSDEVVAWIQTCIQRHPEIISFHHLKTRQSPDKKYLSVHLVFCPIISLLNAHKIADDIEDKIRQNYKDDKWDIQIHLDPYDDSEEEGN
ncbi:cation diffusion facilitator family transporter [Campylobacter insulaenigrae]|uniref:Cation transporter n=1 Tax=Campylobacter insulaenigrae TaxID=260714 RepID=A0ABY3G2Y9_9BACT|nr:cation diffusion facilitator family transporter [Campylobacter insulaenigrae]MCR6570390.1 cation diffusion facilitator family transporter [Campylobacter insulaenigrae]MCR6571792.1 cation diffusion facilitator family transporter [Campylobacter insulaenigrae]MCR6573429.1 cation diffusion facilitator family transporter [Campylobacter insulaenigrae]MCR6574894.1 cation diffusion facilitator family transporter [Campylobacter insulaenigrae]MCR6576414.1 cation diffusion facilitator family transport